ncbi:polymorphic toxin-type HINT domain-containing protein [Streptomyces sp. NPDC090056]|uniref:polymorphic toxin-type HINT domain-containing protein n=1 Tax=Streptomyces sp. NPDC090056 TaxID=3365934 RepID=UPI00382777B3
MALSAVMAVGLLPTTSVALTQQDPGIRTSLPGLKQPKPVPVKPVRAGGTKRPNAAAAKAVTRTAWPSPGTRTVEVLAQNPPKRSTAAGSQLPVSVSAAPGAASKASQTQGMVQTPALTSAQVSVMSRAAAEKAGVDGPLFTVGRADAVTAAGQAHVSLDYSAFKDTYGGDWAARLRLVQLPACALTTPDKAGCRVKKPLKTVNNTEQHTLTAVAPVQGGKSTAGLPSANTMTVLAATAADDGPTGTFKATSLEASGAWSAGGATGAFTWNYPLSTPEVPGGFKPGVTLSYNSQAVDGRTGATNNQAGWIGDGWSYEPAYIERRYKSCEDDKTGGTNTTKVGDQCWYNDNAILSLGGKTSELVFDAAKGWHPVSDGGEKIEKLTAATNGDAGTANSQGQGGPGEHWKLTARDGTQYFFGRNRLPGWASGNPETNSTLTMPVFGNHSGEPCYNASFASAWCQQAWRWNLDYVVDPHGNAMAYFWKKEKNNYGRNVTATGTSVKTQYDRGGYLERIEYGLRDSAPYAAKAMAKVIFTSGDRCENATCPFDAANAAKWPDTPYDLHCADTATDCKTKHSPSFWSSVRLKSISTQVLTGGAYTDVDLWELAQSFPPSGDGITRPMWLDSIKRTAKSGTATTALPLITFGGEQKPNRVDKLGDGLAPFIRLRMSQITTETGGSIGVYYHNPDCTATSLPALDDSNTTRCYPTKWEAEGEIATQDWFNSYVVSRVVEGDNIQGTPDVTTDYSYVGGAEWSMNEDEFTKAAYRQYSVPRGYSLVQTRKGAGFDARTLNETRYFRGIDGAAVKNSAGVAVTDKQQFSGMPRERVVYNGDGGAFVSSTSYTPWTSAATATRSRSGLPALESFMTDTEIEESRAATSQGDRSTKSVRQFDEYGLVKSVSDSGDTAKPGDEKCTTLTYARSAGSPILDKVSRAETVAVACGTSVSRPGDIVDDVRTYYDSQALGTAPVRGLVTKVERVNGDGTGYQVTSSTPSTCGTAGTQLCYDQYGRQLATADAYGAVTKTAFTPATGEVPTGLTVTNPLNHTVTTVLEPRRNQPTKITDANGGVKSIAYDPLGRVTGAWLPTRSAVTYPAAPNYRFSYLVRNDGPIITTKEQLTHDNQYKKSYSFQDGLLRPLQTQDESPDRAGRIVTELFYNSRGENTVDSGTYFTTGAAQPVPVTGQQTMYPSSTETQYDGAGRPLAVIAKRYTDEEKRTTYTYTGDTTTVVPPTGGTATTTVVDALGRTTEVKEYTNTARTTSQSLSYTYDKLGRMATLTDASGAKWTYQYDVRGRQSVVVDPDTGKAVTTYDQGDRPTDITNGRNITLHTDYDKLGRPTALKKGTKLLAAWTYDALNAKGLPAKATRYDDSGNAWVTETADYNRLNLPTTTRFTVPASETGLAGTYEWHTSYNDNTGQVQDVEHPQLADLPYELVSTGYTAVTGLPDIVGTITETDSATLVSDTTYDHYGRAIRTEYGKFGRHVWTSAEYDEHTGQVTKTYTDRDTAPQRVEDTTYTYDPAGNITAIATGYDQGTARTTDTQCFNLDALRRITEAWTNTGTTCAAAPSTSVVGGPDAYWTSYTYDAVGNRKTEVQHKTPSGPAADTTRTYTAPAAGTHKLPGVTQTGANPRTETYTYDATGNTETRKIGTADLETLVWDDEGHLKSTTKVTDTTSYLYDTTGQRLIRRDSTGTTLYLPGGNELHKDKTGKVAGTRYYGDVAMYKAGKLTFLLADHHGTSTTQISNDAAQTVTRRKTTIFGGPRGTQPTNWIGDKGFVGGTRDTDTGLTHLGAREYDPVTGRFISVDPLLEPDKPQSLAGYTYSGNNPITFSDPSGLAFEECVNGMYVCRNKGTEIVEKGKNYNKVVYGVGDEPSPSDIEAYTNPVNQTERYITKQARKHLGTGKKYAEWRKIYQKNISHFPGQAPTEIDLMAAAANSCIGPSSYSCPEELRNIFWDVQKYKDLVVIPGMYGAYENGMPRPPGSGGKTGLGGCGKCFLAGTDVLMADGTTKDIEKIQIGDQVLATDPYTGETGAHEVTQLIVTDDDKKFNELTITTPQGPATLTATHEHPFWAASEHRWLEARDLKPGMTLRADTGQEATISANRAYTQKARTYNLTIDTLHTYYVLAGQTPILVHNSNCGVRQHDKARGAAGVDEMTATFEKFYKKSDIYSESYGNGLELWTPYGVRQVDIAVRQPNGNLHLYEVKVNKSNYTRGQRRKDEWLAKTYGFETSVARRSTECPICNP